MARIYTATINEKTPAYFTGCTAGVKKILEPPSLRSALRCIGRCSTNSPTLKQNTLPLIKTNGFRNKNHLKELEEFYERVFTAGGRYHLYSYQPTHLHSGSMKTYFIANTGESNGASRTSTHVL
jgi:hypothetical protein